MAGRRRPRVQRTVTEDRGRGGHGLDAEYYATLARSGLMSVPYVGGALRRLGLRPRLVRDVFSPSENDPRWGAAMTSKLTRQAGHSFQCAEPAHHFR